LESDTSGPCPTKKQRFCPKGRRNVMSKVLSVMKAIRVSCIDCCGGSPKSVTWCTLDGVHSTRCELWPYRFGCKPSSVKARYGPALVNPSMMPPANEEEDALPIGMAAAAKLLAERAGTVVPERPKINAEKHAALVAMGTANLTRLREARQKSISERRPCVPAASVDLF